MEYLLLRSSRFSFHCYTPREPTPIQKSARKWQLGPFATSCAKDYERHSLLHTSFAEPPNSLYIIYPGPNQLVVRVAMLKGYKYMYLSSLLCCSGYSLYITYPGPNQLVGRVAMLQWLYLFTFLQWLYICVYICSFRAGTISKQVTISVQHASNLGPSRSSCEWP